VLLPTDDSPSARRAAQHLIDVVREGRVIEVHLLNVQLPVRGSAATLIAKADLDDYHREEGMKALAATKAMLEAAGITPKLHVGVGDAGEVIVAFAQRLGCRQIIMGTRGLGAAGSLVLGSVTTHVVSATELPVTLLRAS
jgi:nucleotide-binding universal stress UspA family protein